MVAGGTVRIKSNQWSVLLIVISISQIIFIVRILILLITSLAYGKR